MTPQPGDGQEQRTGNGSDQVSSKVIGVAAVGLVALVGLLALLSMGGSPAEETAASGGSALAEDADIAGADAVAEARPLTPNQLSQICDGIGHDGAADVSTSPGRRMMQVAALRQGEWERRSAPNADEGEDELPADVVELVACRRPLPEPETTDCSYRDRPHLVLSYHSEAVEVRAARTGELLDETLVGATTPACPAVVWVENNRTITDFYNDTEVRAYLLGQAGDGTRPDLSFEEQVEALCRNSRGVSRIPDASAGSDTAIAVVAVESEIEVLPGLAGPIGTDEVTRASHILCLRPDQTVVHRDDQTCMRWIPTLVRLEDGVVLYSIDVNDERELATLREICVSENWAEGLAAEFDMAPVLASLEGQAGGDAPGG